MPADTPDVHTSSRVPVHTKDAGPHEGIQKYGLTAAIKDRQRLGWPSASGACGTRCDCEASYGQDNQGLTDGAHR